MRRPTPVRAFSLRRFSRVMLVLLLGMLCAGSLAYAQRIRARFAQGQPIRWATRDSFDGAFLFCRIEFQNQRYPYGDGAGWWVDYPRADLNLSTRFAELTTVLVSRDGEGAPNHVVVQLTDPELFHCPFVMLTEPGGAYFDEAEAAQLKTYLMKGGFLWVDDFWGERAWRNWASQIAKALPREDFAPVDVPIDHQLFHVLYDMKRIPQIPSIGFWQRTGGRTSERGIESAEPHVRAIFDARGRIMVLMTHNTDFGDAFEREGENYKYFQTFAPEGYAFGVNALLYAHTH